MCGIKLNCLNVFFHLAILTYLQGLKYLLLGAANDNALCQMALAYRHFIGADGLHKDCDIAIGRISAYIIIICIIYYHNFLIMPSVLHTFAGYKPGL